MYALQTHIVNRVELPSSAHPVAAMIRFSIAD